LRLSSIWCYWRACKNPGSV